MNNREQDNRLFAAWRNDRRSTDRQGECPSDAEIFDAVTLKLPVQRRREIVLHTAACGACAESWRLASELLPPAEVVDISERHARLRWRNPQALGLAAAACLVLMVGIVWILPTSDPGYSELDDSTTLRGDVEHAIQLAIPEAARLSVADFELRWDPVQGIEEYRVQMTDAQLQTVFVDSTATNRLTVPASALSSIESGEPIYWHVSAIDQDGSMLRSPTQTLIVERPAHSE